MKKKILLVVILVINFYGFGQEDPIGIPQIVPVSPEATSLGKYGEVPVNIATGKINYTVPIYTIKVGGFEWPIYLSYNYNGLMVEQDPPLTGLGWDLMASGRITRQIRGIPDERGASANIQYKKNVIVPYLEQDNSVSNWTLSDLFNLYRNIETKTFDGQNDKYYINAGNLSGSYVYNEDNEVVFLNYRNYKIDGTIITDERGIKYYFEQSELGDFNINNPEGEYLTEPIPISYLLTKIELANNNGVINFEFYPTIAYDKEIFSETEVTSRIFNNEIKISSVFKTIRYTPIKKIIFPNGEVRFDITTAYDNDIQASSLNNISVWNNNLETLNYSFNYSNSAKSLKTLNTINKNSNNVVLPWYSFEYHNLPNSLDYKQQDIWGFYNGIPNANLINGDRGVVFNETVSGALKTINYPTGGSTEIDYEQNKIVSYASNSNGDCTYSHNETIIGQLIGDSNPKHIDTIITLPSNQVVKVYAYARVGNGSATNVNMFGAEASIEIETIGSTTCGFNSININMAVYGEEVPCENEPGGDPCPENYTENDEQIGFTGNTRIYIRGSVEAPQGKEAKIFYRIDYEDRINEDKFIGGIRVSQTKDCSNLNDCITTDYKYLDEYGKSSGYLLGADAVYSYSIYGHNNGPTHGWRHYRSTNSMQDFNSFQNAPVLYNRVELLKNGDDNGKIIKHFSIFGNEGELSLPFIGLENKDWKNGKLLKTEIFKKQNGQFTLLKVEENVYDEFFSYGEGKNSSLKAYNFDVAQINFIWGDPDVPGSEVQHAFNYREKSTIDYPKAYKLTKTISTEYLSSDNLQTETIYDYNIPSLFLKETNTTNSTDNTLTSKSFYTFDKPNLTNLTTEASTAIDSLIAQHRIATPIQSEFLKDGVLQSSQRTNYKDWGLNGAGTGNIILPEIIETAKGSEVLDPRLIYHKYDTYGNLLEVSKKEGSHLVYIWGYNNQSPVAKIENATYSQIEGLTYFGNGFDLGSGNLSTDQENSLRTGLSNSQVTTYTYDPLIGVTSITDPSGYTSYYVYDDFNRLQFIKDKDENVLKSYKYHYQGQADSGTGTQYTVTSTTGGNGTVTVSSTVNEGDDLQVNISQNSGYEISSIKVNNVTQPISNSFIITNVTSNLTIDVIFSLISNITVSYVIDGGTNGTVNISPSVVSNGGSSTVSLTPDSGYEVDYVKVGTTSYTVTNNTATITNITSNTTVNVKFKALALTVSPTSINFNTVGSNRTVSVTTSGAWTVSKSNSWLTISTTTGSGNGAFTVSTLENTGSTRFGSVTVSNGSTTKIISIEQLDGSGGGF